MRRLSTAESPIDELSYGTCCDDFLGGVSFVRILQPLWMQDAEEHVCSCKAPMTFVACIGNQSYDAADGIVDGRPFFIGEAALYFFLCPNCMSILVTSQST